MLVMHDCKTINSRIEISLDWSIPVTNVSQWWSCCSEDTHLTSKHQCSQWWFDLIIILNTLLHCVCVPNHAKQKTIVIQDYPPTLYSTHTDHMHCSDACTNESRRQCLVKAWCEYWGKILYMSQWATAAVSASHNVCCDAWNIVQRAASWVNTVWAVL